MHHSICSNKLILNAATLLTLIMLNAASYAASQKDFAGNLSADAKHLVYYSYRGDNLPDIFLSDVSGNNEINITNSKDSWDIEPAFSPTKSTIAFARGPSMKNMQIFTMGIDGTNQVQVTDNSGTNSAPQFSADGNFLVYHQFFGAERSYIHKINLHTGQSTQLTDDHFVASSPSFSPSGKNVVFISKDKKSGQSDIFIMKSDGSDKRQITDSKALERKALYSKDGKYLIVTMEQDNRPSGLFLMNLITNEISPLTNSQDTHSYFASLSPNGKSLYYDIGNWNSNFFIHSARMNEGELAPTQITGVRKTLNENSLFTDNLAPFVGTWEGQATEGQSAGHFKEITEYQWGPNKRSLVVNMQIFWDGQKIDEGRGIIGIDKNTETAYFNLVMSDGGLIHQYQTNPGNTQLWNMNASSKGTQAFPQEFKTELVKGSKDNWQSKVMMLVEDKWTTVSVHQFVRLE